MSRKRNAISWARQQPEQDEAIGMLLSARGVFHEINIAAQNESHPADGPGVILFMFRGETIDSMEPMGYVPWSYLQKKPLVPIALLSDLAAEMAQYDPKRHYYILAAGHKGAHAAWYGWWKVDTALTTRIWKR